MKKVLFGLATAAFLTAGFLPGMSANAATNLITNPSFETGSGGAATGWTTDKWGTLTTQFTIAATDAHSGNRSSKVAVTSYASGDAKWSTGSVAVMPNTSYTVSDYYIADVATELDAEVTLSNGSVQYLWLTTAPKATAWTQTKATLKTPANAKSVRIWHVINKKGTLQTDDFVMELAAPTTATPTISVTPTITPTPTLTPTVTPTTTPTPTPTTTPTPTLTPKPTSTPTTTPTPTVTPTPSATPTPSVQNLVPNNSVEDGATNAINGWLAGYWGSMAAQFTTVGGAQDGARAARIDVSNYASGDAKWVFNNATVVPNTRYTFSDYYRSNVTTQLCAAVTLQDGIVQYLWIADLPAASAWTKASGTVTTPATAKSMTVYHLIYANGWLETDNVSLTAPAATPTPSMTPTPTPTVTPTPTPTTTPKPTGAFSRPLASIEFDDGWTSAYQNGLPIVESFGWKATEYIITDTAVNNSNYGTGTYMTPAQIKDWNKRGDVGSHTVDHPHLPTMSLAQITAELTNSKTYLDNLLGEPTNLLVTPYCESSATVTNVAKTLYQSMRNCDSPVNTKANFDRYNLQSFNVLSTTTDAEFQSFLDQAKASNGWVIFVWHMIDTSGDEYSKTPAQFQHQLQMIKDSGITVKLTQDALNESLGL